ncbi:7646_t:CDS:10 [Entrophospora sp. SA101]|nr:7646_t:CDS:10 [Entrophospora sp. SA101]
MSKVIHQYFNRRYSEWDITDFLQECELEDLADANKGQRGNKAKELLARYRECWGGDNLEDCLTFKAQGRPNTNPTGAGAISRIVLRSRLKDIANLQFYMPGFSARSYLCSKLADGDYLNNGITSNGSGATNISHTKCGQRQSSKDLNDKINEFMLSPNEQELNRFTKKLRKLYDTIKYKSTCSDEDNDFYEDDESREMSESSISEFKDSYRGMKNEKKWYLTSGKCVEDALYAFGNQWRFDHLAHSFIIDPDDESYIKNNIFTSEELKEICNTEAKDLPEMPNELLKYISSFRMKTTKDLHIALDVRQDWEGGNFDRIKHFDFDWVKNKFESDTLQQKHLEAWHNVHIWSFIDRCFNELRGVDIARGESFSIASSKRKNSKRVIQGVVKTTRKAIRRKGDLTLRKGSHEYVASEVGKDYEGDNGTKLLKERGLKSPKMLKDMIVDLGNFVEWKTNTLRQFELISFIHAGLYMILLRMDVPAGYTCRVTRSDTLQVPTNINRFEKALKCLVLAWKAKIIIRKTINVVEKTCDDDLLEDLQEAGARKQKDLTIVPNCVMTPQKKRTANMINILIHLMNLQYFDYN